VTQVLTSISDYSSRASPEVVASENHCYIRNRSRYMPCSWTSCLQMLPTILRSNTIIRTARLTSMVETSTRCPTRHIHIWSRATAIGPDGFPE